MTTMLQLAVLLALVAPEQDCAPAPLPSVKVSVRLEFGVTPSSFKVAEKVAGMPLASSVGLVAANLVTVSSLVTVNVVEAELGPKVESPANVAVSVTGPAAWFGVIRQVAVPVTSVVPEHVGAPDPEPSLNVTVSFGTGAPPVVVVSLACTWAASSKSEVVALAAVKASVVD